MGGDAKNVVFVKGDGGFLVLVSGIDLPDAMKRIELRLQRNGDRCTAWYRQVGGTWQEIGSTEIVLDSTVDVGITQVTQYTMSEISADFDYFRLFLK
jgi:beta-xylosidase